MQDSSAVRPPEALAAQREFVMRLAGALHTYGTPVHRLEAAVEEVSRTLGLGVSVFATPTAVFTSFRVPGGAAETRFDRQNAGEVDLGKLCDLDEVARLVTVERIDAKEGSLRVEAIVGRDPGPNLWRRWVAYGSASTGFAVFFGASFPVVLWSFVLGASIGVLERLLVPGRWQRLFEPLGALVIAFLAGLIAAYFGVSAALLTVAGVIVLVPGLSLTQSVTELAQGSLVSGSSRLLGAMLTFLMLGFGAELGRRAVMLVAEVPAIDEVDAWPLVVQLLAVALSSLAFATIFRASPRDWLAIVALTEVTYVTIFFVRPSLGPVFTALVGALVVGCGSNLYARIRRRPSLVLRVPAMLILVPGSFGLRSVLLLVQANTFQGVETAFTMLFLAVALAAGLLTANALVLPRQRL